MKGQNIAKIEAEKAAAKKKAAQDELADLNKLFKPVTEMPKIAGGDSLLHSENLSI